MLSREEETAILAECSSGSAGGFLTILRTLAASARIDDIARTIALFLKDRDAKREEVLTALPRILEEHYLVLYRAVDRFKLASVCDETWADRVREAAFDPQLLVELVDEAASLCLAAENWSDAPAIQNG